MFLKSIKKTSFKIYKSIIHGAKRNPKKHMQMVYDVLLKLDNHFIEIRNLPKEVNNNAWKAICMLYKNEFSLNIQSFFKSKINYGTYASYIVNEESRELDFWNYKGHVEVKQLSMDIEKEYTAWVWRYFGSQVGGWVDSKVKKTIYHVSDAYKSLIGDWTSITDEKSLDEWKVRASKDLDYHNRKSDEVFYSEGLNARFQLKYRNHVYKEATDKYNDVKKQKEYFIKTIYKEQYRTFIAHEGQHTIDMRNILSNIKTFSYALMNKTKGFSSAYEYRAKLSELYYSKIPYRTLANLMSKDINGSSSHGKANTLIFERFVKYIKDNPNEFENINVSNNIMLQLDLLDSNQIRIIVKSIF